MNKYNNYSRHRESGKTATLRYLYYLLLGNNNVSTFKSTVNGYKDFRAVVRFNNIYIYLSTVGDDIVDVDDNWDFFFNRLKKKIRPCINYPTDTKEGKIIAALCDIHKDVTFHVARHTFATTVTLENGIPMMN